MAEKITPKELEQMMDRMFSVNSEDCPFFRKYMNELSQTDEGSHLLRSLDKKFNGEKITLQFENADEMLGGAKGNFLPKGPKIIIKKYSKFKSDALTPGILFHELTHWKQYLNSATCEDTLTETDSCFTYWMQEADARVSTFFFVKELSSQGNWWQRYKNRSKNRIRLNAEVHWHDHSNPELYVRQVQDFIKSRHTDWTDEQVQKETKKMMLISVLRERNVDSGWHRIYDHDIANPFVRALGGGFDANKFDNYGVFKRRHQIMDVMGYYMTKYGLTSEECLNLQQVTISNPSIELPKQETRKVDEYTTDIYQDGICTHRIVKQAGKTEIKYLKDFPIKQLESIIKSDGSSVLITKIGPEKSISVYDNIGRIISLKKYDTEENLSESQRWDHNGKEPSYEGVWLVNGKLLGYQRSFACGVLSRFYETGETKIRVREYAVVKDKNGDLTYYHFFTTHNKPFKLVNGEFVSVSEYNPEPPTSEELKCLQDLVASAKKVEQLDAQYPNTLMEEFDKSALNHGIPSIKTQNPANSEVLLQASALREQPIATPKTSVKTKTQKLDSATLAHLGGNDGKNG